jgi:hypothetical protein
MKPISVPLPFLGLILRIEAAPAARPGRSAGARPQLHLLKSALRQSLGPRELQDIGLDHSRRD